MLRPPPVARALALFTPAARVHAPHSHAAVILLAALLFTLSCADTARRARTELILASTTSLYDSGLLDELLPSFEAAQPTIRVKLVAVGSGHALELGRRGDADVLLIHSPDDEDAFMAGGHGVRREAVMRNDFVVVGPASDPAVLAGSPTVLEGMRRIAATRPPFISRGDSSGTHRSEVRLWQQASVAGHALHFRTEVGQGMGETLVIASERRAYTLTDRATFAALSGRLGLVVLAEGGAEAVNRYSVITVAGARHAAGADAFADWITSHAARDLIVRYGADGHGRPLFDVDSR
ncbi:extracellular solute-binding protein [soil metagenome]